MRMRGSNRQAPQPSGPQRERRTVELPFLDARGAARSAAGKKLRAAPLRQAGQPQAMLLQMRKERGPWCGRTRARTCATIGNNRGARIGDAKPEAMDDARRRSIRRTPVLMSLCRRCQPSTQAPGRRYPDESPGRQARHDGGGALGHQQQADGHRPLIACDPGRKDEQEDDGPPDGGRVAVRA